VYLIAALVFLGATLTTFTVGMLVVKKNNPITERLQQLVNPRVTSTIERVSLRKTDYAAFWAGIFRRFSQLIPLSPAASSHYRKKLIQAGYYGRETSGIFWGAKALSALIFFCLGVFLCMAMEMKASGFLLAVAALALAGFWLPNYLLNYKIRQRKEEIILGLPDALDLLVICVEAGLSLNVALIKLAQEERFTSPALRKELWRVVQEIRAGKPRAEALKAMSERTDIKEVRSLVAMLIQTEKLGTSLAQSLRVYADSLRVKRRQKAEEAAAESVVKIIFPLVFFILPALFVVVLGPAVIQIMNSLIK
jgi:tight adherence protein C